MLEELKKLNPNLSIVFKDGCETVLEALARKQKKIICAFTLLIEQLQKDFKQLRTIHVNRITFEEKNSSFYLTTSA